MNKTQDNFDWSFTNRKIIIFIPNFGRAKFIERTLPCFKTNLDKSDWGILTVNDRYDENLAHLENENFRYFTLNPTENPPCRNGAKVRNYVIKRCLSEYFFQKDPETYIVGLVNDNYDWIEHASRINNCIYRIGNVQMVSQEDTDKVFVDANPRDIMATHRIDPSYWYHIHHGFSVKTKLLQDLNGYIEVPYYSGEDKFMYYSLLTRNYPLIVDYSLCSLHLNHPIDPYANSREHWMCDNYLNSLNPLETHNLNGWGEG